MGVKTTPCSYEAFSINLFLNLPYITPHKRYFKLNKKLTLGAMASKRSMEPEC